MPDCEVPATLFGSGPAPLKATNTILTAIMQISEIPGKKPE